MAEYEFSLTISGVVVAYSEEEARQMLAFEPQRWGNVDIEELSLISEEDEGAYDDL